MTRKKPTVMDLRALKGKGQLTMLRLFTLDEAAAAEEAGIDIVSVPPDLVSNPAYRKVAPSLFSMTGVDHRSAGTRDDYLRFAGRMLNAGADAVYCSGSLATVKFLADEHIPVVGHVGLVPSRNTFTGGFKAVGKTAAAALALLDEVRAYEAAGAFAVIRVNQPQPGPDGVWVGRRTFQSNMQPALGTLVGVKLGGATVLCHRQIDSTILVEVY